MTKNEKDILNRINEFCTANNKRAALELIGTLLAFFTFFGLMIYSLGVSYWLTALFLLPTGVFLTRIFTIQHDCGHNSFFSSLKVNNYVGNTLGILTLTPYYYWKKSHNVHHAFSGNLDKRGIGDIRTLTVKEYSEASLGQKIWYRIYRNAAFMLIIGPIFIFGLKHRFPIDTPFNSRKSWVNIMATNVGLAVVMTAIVQLFGWEALFLVYFPSWILASSIGVTLFFIHHQYEDMYWNTNEEWSYFKAGMYGSSYFEFTKYFSWLVSNINLHHIHHLNGHVPFYRLRECFDAIPELREVPKRTFKDIPNCFKLALWDEDSKKMVRFSTA